MKSNIFLEHQTMLSEPATDYYEYTVTFGLPSLSVVGVSPTACFMMPWSH